MTTTTSTAHLRDGQASAASSGMRRMAAAVGSVLSTIGARWSQIIDTAQLGPDAERDIGRNTGARI